MAVMAASGTAGYGLRHMLEASARPNHGLTTVVTSSSFARRGVSRASACIETDALRVLGETAQHLSLRVGLICRAHADRVELPAE